MNKVIKLVTILGLSLSGFGGYSQVAQADIDKLDNLYQIELIVFENNLGAGSGSAEIWPKNIELRYPLYTLSIVDPVKQAERKAKEEELLQRRQSLALPEDFYNIYGDSGKPEEPSEDDTSSQEDTSANVAPSPNNENTTNSDEVNLDEQSLSIQGFNVLEQLPEDLRQLNNKAQALSRSRGYRVLYHQSWFQNLEAKEEAPAIAIEAGGQYGDFYELQGSISIYLSRYLHISTDLWFSQFEPNVGQQPYYWPSLPQPKLASLYDVSWVDDWLQAQGRAPELSGDDNGFKLNVDAYQGSSAWSSGARFSENSLNSSGFSSTANDQSDYSGEDFETGPSGQSKAQDYLIKEIVTMRDRRRMRSTELHYLDNPKLGLLVVITPVDDERLEAINAFKDSTNDLEH